MKNIISSKSKLCIFLIALPFIITLICIPFLPNTVAFHFSFNTVDQYANKFCLLIMPSLILVVGLFNLKIGIHRTNTSMFRSMIPLLWVGMAQFFILLYKFFPNVINIFLIFRLYISVHYLYLHYISLKMSNPINY